MTCSTIQIDACLSKAIARATTGLQSLGNGSLHHWKQPMPAGRPSLPERDQTGGQEDRSVLPPPLFLYGIFWAS